MKDSGLQVIEWDLSEGAFEELPDIVLGSSPVSLLQTGHLLFGFGADGINAVAVHQLPDLQTWSTARRPRSPPCGEPIRWSSVRISTQPGYQSASTGWRRLTSAPWHPASIATARDVAHENTEEWIPVDLRRKASGGREQRRLCRADPADYDWRLQPSLTKVGYEAWAASHFVSSGDLPLPEADSDHDGWSNAAEFALGTAPNDPNP